MGQDQREAGNVEWDFKTIAKGTGLLPVFAFIFCLGWSLLFDFEKTTETHCEEPEFLPSISSVIGSHIPQKYAWNLSIALHSAPRFLFCSMYWSFFQNRLASSSHRILNLAYVAYYLNFLENVSLLGLSFVPSGEVFLVHATCFILFILSSISYMTISTYILFPRLKSKSPLERISHKYKKSLLHATVVSVILCCYFYWRHNEYCEPYVYSFFALFEYVVVFSNIAYHMTAFYDFENFHILVKSSGKERKSMSPMSLA